MIAERWTLCRGCMKPVEVTIIPRCEGDGAGWSYLCDEPCGADDGDAKQRERAAGSGPVDWSRDVLPPDPLVLLTAIVGAVVERAGREAVGVALGFISAPPKPEPADPNQINLPFPDGAS